MCRIVIYMKVEGIGDMLCLKRTILVLISSSYFADVDPFLAHNYSAHSSILVIYQNYLNIGNTIFDECRLRECSKFMTGLDLDLREIRGEDTLGALGVEIYFFNST